MANDTIHIGEQHHMVLYVNLMKCSVNVLFFLIMRISVYKQLQTVFKHSSEKITAKDYDSPAVTSEQNSGVQFKEIFQMLTIYVHCSAHQLILIMEKTNHNQNLVHQITV